MNWDFVYDQYLVNKEMIWLNNCGTTPAGIHVTQAMKAYMDDYARMGVSMPLAQTNDVPNAIKGILARELHCDADELAIIHNTSEGMNFVSHGLSLRQGDEIILLEHEYPSNVYPWWHWKKKGIQIKTAPVGESPEEFLCGLKKLLTPKTKVVAVSAVHWCTGMPLPLEDIGLLCRDRGIDFVLDGAQGVGLVPIDTKKCHISYMAFSAWKWLMGPLGLGMMYVPKENLNRLELAFWGTNSVADDKQYLPYKAELKTNADRFTFSSENYNDWVYFKASLEFLDSIGFKNVMNRILELANHLREGLRSIGYKVYSDRFSSHATGIVACEKEGRSSTQLVTSLKEQKIVMADRLARVRMSPHVYNSKAQLEKVVDVLARI